MCSQSKERRGALLLAAIRDVCYRQGENNSQTICIMVTPQDHVYNGHLSLERIALTVQRIHYTEGYTIQRVHYTEGTLYYTERYTIQRNTLQRGTLYSGVHSTEGYTIQRGTLYRGVHYTERYTLQRVYFTEGYTI